MALPNAQLHRVWLMVYNIGQIYFIIERERGVQQTVPVRSDHLEKKCAEELWVNFSKNQRGNCFLLFKCISQKQKKLNGAKGQNLLVPKTAFRQILKLVVLIKWRVNNYNIVNRRPT
jgi:hypothetical protein